MTRHTRVLACRVTDPGTGAGRGPLIPAATFSSFVSLSPASAGLYFGSVAGPPLSASYSGLAPQLVLDSIEKVFKPLVSRGVAQKLNGSASVLSAERGASYSLRQ
jgi:hypothetical protein